MLGKNVTSGFGIILSVYTPTGLFASQQQNANWIRNIKDLKPSLTLPAQVEAQVLNIPVPKIEKRLNLSHKDPRIEGIVINLENDHKKVINLADRIARPHMEVPLGEIFIHKLKNSTNQKQVSVEIDKAMFTMIDPEKLANLWKTVHYQVNVNPRMINNDQQTQLMHQTFPYFSASQKTSLQNKLQNNQILSTDEDLLPQFAKKMLKKYLIYRGPNCFHAALSFQNPLFTSSSLFNVKIEEGYHRSMINYDELWRILEMYFYPVNPQVSDLKYGDMLVFFDLPQGQSPDFVNFKWIRHTATYLFSGFTFSKGSKSPNSPYTVKTLKEEWNTWDRFSQNMAVKLFRRNTKYISKVPRQNPSDWLY